MAPVTMPCPGCGCKVAQGLMQCPFCGQIMVWRYPAWEAVVNGRPIDTVSVVMS